jgi:hypothetical protein
MVQQIKQVSMDECVIVADFKENLRLPISKESVQQDFFESAPVTVLAFVVYLRGATGYMETHAVVVLSRCLSHTAAFVLEAIRTVLALPFLSHIRLLRWWSDGGPHFRNRQLLAALAHPLQLLGRQFDAELNYLESHHGKNVCDSVFGRLSQLLQHNLPPGGIRSFQQLLSFFRSATPPLLQTAELPGAHDTFLELALYSPPSLHSLTLSCLVWR